MKKAILMFALIGLTFVSCKKDDKDPEPEPTPTPTPTPTGAAAGTIRGTFDGAVFNSTALSTMCVWNGSGYSVQGVGTENGVSKSISFSLGCAQGAAVGTYTLSTTGGVTSGKFVGACANDTINYSTAGSTNATGTLTVTSFGSSKISGTFSFTKAKSITGGTAMTDVTSGSFTDVKVY